MIEAEKNSEDNSEESKSKEQLLEEFNMLMAAEYTYLMAAEYTYDDSAM